MKGKIKYIIFIILFLLAILSIYILSSFKPNTKEEEKEVFKVNKILCYTSASAVSSEEEIETNWEVDIYQYTDIAIYIEKLQEKTIAQLYIDNIEILKKPILGNTNICKKKLEDFAKPMQLKENLEHIQFEVSEKAEFSQDCVKPITLSYVNNIKQSYTITNTEEKLEYNETILKRAKILTSDLMAQISFNVNIIDAENEKYICKITLDIPIEELMNGQKKIEKTENVKFIREGMI